ncbi:MAG: SatD family protein [Pyrinomonadaceae bacterium]
MIAVITADIIKSTLAEPGVWLEIVKSELNRLGSNPRDWEIYRGDSFQCVVEPAEAILSAIKLKAALKSNAQVDIRIAVGLGDKTYDSDRITESSGSAFVHSGAKFEMLRKEKQNIGIRSDYDKFDAEINLYLKLGLIAMDNWTKNSAEIVNLVLENPNLSQLDIGQLIGIKQTSVSLRLKRAYFYELMEMNEMYKAKLQMLL